MLGIGALLERRPAQLSGGQQQRVALGRAIVAQAPVCLMDEPLSNLDAQLRAEMRREILALQRRLGITMLYVTHDQTEAMAMADQVVLLRHGRIEQDAPPATLYERPESAFAAGFVGAPPMNLLALERRGVALVPRGLDGPALAPAARDAALAGLRPEALRLAARGLHAPVLRAPVLHARVLHAEFLGADTVIACDAGPHRLLARVPGRVALPDGAAVALGFDAADLHLFAADGRRLGAVTQPETAPA